jgi:hypothetical protein
MLPVLWVQSKYLSDIRHVGIPECSRILRRGSAAPPGTAISPLFLAPTVSSSNVIYSLGNQCPKSE